MPVSADGPDMKAPKSADTPTPGEVPVEVFDDPGILHRNSGTKSTLSASHVAATDELKDQTTPGGGLRAVSLPATPPRWTASVTERRPATASYDHAFQDPFTLPDATSESVRNLAVVGD